MKSGVLSIEVQLNVQKQFEFEIFGYHTIGNRLTAVYVHRRGV